MTNLDITLEEYNYFRRSLSMPHDEVAKQLGVSPDVLAEQVRSLRAEQDKNGASVSSIVREKARGISNRNVYDEWNDASYNGSNGAQAPFSGARPQRPSSIELEASRGEVPKTSKWAGLRTVAIGSLIGTTMIVGVYFGAKAFGEKGSSKISAVVNSAFTGENADDVYYDKVRRNAIESSEKSGKYDYVKIEDLVRVGKEGIVGNADPDRFPELKFKTNFPLLMLHPYSEDSISRFVGTDSGFRNEGPNFSVLDVNGFHKNKFLVYEYIGGGQAKIYFSNENPLEQISASSEKISF